LGSSDQTATGVHSQKQATPAISIGVYTAYSRWRMTATPGVEKAAIDQAGIFQPI
jgi:hypothetical protein